MILKTPIVGAQFRPPAAALLRVLPVGHPLYIEPEPLNEYDPDALRIMLSLSTLDIDNNEQISTILSQTNLTAQKSLEDFINNNALHIGYVARSTNSRSCQIDNKPSIGNTELINTLAHNKLINPITQWRYEAKLTFSMNGQPLIEVDIP